MLWNSEKMQTDKAFFGYDAKPPKVQPFSKKNLKNYNPNQNLFTN